MQVHELIKQLFSERADLPVFFEELKITGITREKDKIVLKGVDINVSTESPKE